MIKEYRIGLIGFGSMGKTHTFSVNALPYYYKDLPFRAKVAAVCTRSQEKSDAVCAEFGIECGVTDENELINSPDIDIIDICTPNFMHADTLRAAIKAGKSIYCEKPICVSLEDADEIAAMAREAGVSASMVFNNRYFAPVMRAKELIDEGRIGRPVSFHASFMHASATNPEKPAGWKQNKDICGGGVLFDLGAHVIDMIRYLCGEFSDVYGRSQIFYPVRKGSDGREWSTNADEAFFLLCTLASGAVGTVDLSKITVGTNDDFRFEYYGTDGAIKFDLMETGWLWYYDAGKGEAPLGGERGWQKIECLGHFPAPGGSFPGGRSPVGWLRGHIGSMYNFLDRLYRGVPQCPSLDDGAAVQRILCAAYKSDEIGAKVSVSDMGASR